MPDKQWKAAKRNEAYGAVATPPGKSDDARDDVSPAAWGALFAGGAYAPETPASWVECPACLKSFAGVARAPHHAECGGETD